MTISEYEAPEQRIMTDGGQDVEKYFEDETLEEIAEMFEASKKIKLNPRVSTLAAIDQVQRTKRTKGEELINELTSLDEEKYDFLPEDSWQSSNVKNNAERYRDIGVLQDDYLLTGKGVDLLNFVDEMNEWFQSPEYFEHELKNAFSEGHRSIADSMGQKDVEATEDIANYLNDIVKVDPIEENPLDDRDYTITISGKLNSLSGDRLKAFMALAENPDLSYMDIAAHTESSKNTISNWKNEPNGWKENSLMEDGYSNKELTPVGEAFHDGVKTLYKERKG